MSKSLGPGAIALLNGTGIQTTSSRMNPRLRAMVQATWLSKPWWLVGSPSSHGSVFGSEGWKYGG